MPLAPIWAPRMRSTDTLHMYDPCMRSTDTLRDMRLRRTLLRPRRSGFSASKSHGRLLLLGLSPMRSSHLVVRRTRRRAMRRAVRRPDAPCNPPHYVPHRAGRWADTSAATTCTDSTTASAAATSAARRAASRTIPHRPAPSRTVPHRPAPSRAVPHRPAPFCIAAPPAERAATGPRQNGAPPHAPGSPERPK